jgi:hypothetical protein
MTHADLANQITDWAASDHLIITRGGDDYYETAATIAALMSSYIRQTYDIIQAVKNIFTA